MNSDRKRSEAPQKAAEPPNSPLMSITETAEFLGLSRNMVYAEAQAGRLPIVRFGRRILVVRALLNDMILGEARAAWRALKKDT